MYRPRRSTASTWTTTPSLGRLLVFHSVSAIPHHSSARFGNALLGGASQTATNSGQRGHLGRLERKRNTHFGLSLDQMRRKARREWKNCLDIKKVVGMDQTRRSKEFTIPGIAKIGSPEIHHKCGVSATNFPARCSTESTRGGTSARPRTMRAGECGHDAGACGRMTEARKGRIISAAGLWRR